MRPSVMTPVELTGSSPFARSTVVTVSIPRPEKTGGRRTLRHWRSGRAACLPRRYVGSHAFTWEDASTALFRAVAASAVIDCVGVTHGTATGRDWDETTRTVVPIWRASMYEPSSVSVFTTLSDDGSETSTSVSIDVAAIGAIMRADIAGSGSIQ